jgi:hypothetical protein
MLFKFEDSIKKRTKSKKFSSFSKKRGEDKGMNKKSLGVTIRFSEIGDHDKFKILQLILSFQNS